MTKFYFKLKFKIVFLAFLFPLFLNAQYNENFNGVTNVPSGWHNVWGEFSIQNEALFTTAGQIISPLIGINWDNADAVRISFRYKNWKNPDNMGETANNFTLQIWPEHNSGQAYPVVDPDNAYPQYLFGPDVNFKTAFITLMREDWEHNSLVLSFNMSGGSSAAISYIDDIAVTALSSDGKPVANFTSDATKVNVGDKISLFDISENIPTSFLWSFEPNNVTFVNSTALSQNPVVEFTEAGLYAVSLWVENADGYDIITIPNYIEVSCVAQSNDFYNGHISNVIINGAENISANKAYSNFSHLYNEVDLNNEDNVNLIITTIADNTKDFFDPIWWGVHIDWDGNGIFDEVPYTHTTVYTDVIKNWIIPIPENQPTGNVKARIILGTTEQQVTNACTTVSNGEVEDYSITFVRLEDENLGTNLCKKEADDDGVFIINKKGSIIVSFNDYQETTPALIEVISVTGTIVNTSKSNGRATEIKLPSAKGVYLIKVTKNNKVKTFKVIAR